MKSILNFKRVVFLTMALITTISCGDKIEKQSTEIALNTKVKASKTITKINLSKEFKEYWYAGKAEITSYTLAQARYREIRQGSAVLIYVTEPFLNNIQVKADGPNASNVPVLKLNATKNYITGIYPYAIMTSSFYPVYDNQNAIKVSFSSQEWCGHVYTQLNNRDKFQIKSNSYFEGEADQEFKLEKTVLENEIWNKIRINPENLPQGNLTMIPSFEYVRLAHKELKAYEVNTTLTKTDGEYSYQINYPELDRTLKINFKASFPYIIENWSDSFTSGYGANAKTLTSTGTKIKTLNTPYWRQNGNKDLYLRDSLGL